MKRVLWMAIRALGCIGLIVCGCGVVLSPIPDPALLPAPVPTAAAQYRAYGDSITYGATLVAPEKPYPAYVAGAEGVSFSDNALSRDQACDVPTRQIFPHQDAPTLATHPTYSLLIGTNDVIAKGAGAYEAVYTLCQQATISWLGIPAEHKSLAGGSGMTATGPGAIESANHWNAWTTEGLDASVSFTITTSESGPVYAWPRIDDYSPATYTYALDGVVAGRASTQTTPRIATLNSSSNSLGFLRLPAVPPGTHVVTFTQTSAGSSGVSVVGIGVPGGPAADLLPKVLVGTIPFQKSDDCDSSDGACEKYIRDTMANVLLFSGDGLHVRLFDTRKFMFATGAEMNDYVHPNERGQYELSKAVEASW
jgi:hypothetical protein